jgi:hypothetical protein
MSETRADSPEATVPPTRQPRREMGWAAPYVKAIALGVLVGAILGGFILTPILKNTRTSVLRSYGPDGELTGYHEWKRQGDEWVLVEGWGTKGFLGPGLFDRIADPINEALGPGIGGIIGGLFGWLLCYLLRKARRRAGWRCFAVGGEHDPDS